MKINELLRNPIIKIIGIVAIIYFALFADKKNPESLGHRFAKDKIEKNLHEAKQKSSFIITNVNLAQQMAKEKDAKNVAGNNSENRKPVATSIEDLEEGSGDEKIICGDEVVISYGLYTKQGRQIQFQASEKLIIGVKSNWLIEQNIIGMKQGGIRNINIPQGYEANDKKLTEMLKFNASDLQYRITVLTIIHHPDSGILCT